MQIKLIIWSILVSSILGISSSLFAAERAADSGAYIGGGLNNLALDGEDSVNMSIMAGYNFHKWRFESTNIQALTLGIEIQYSDSISDTDDVKNYSVFAALRAHISDQWYLKIKQGYTDFPDVTLRKSGAESSHVGAGIGLGYRINSGSIEVEYVYVNKTIDASLIEVSYKYYF